MQIGNETACDENDSGKDPPRMGLRGAAGVLGCFETITVKRMSTNVRKKVRKLGLDHHRDATDAIATVGGRDVQDPR